MHKHDFDAGGRLENSSSLCTHPSHPSLHTLSLGVSIHGFGHGHSGTLRHEESTRSTTRNSRLASSRFSAIHLFFPFSFFVPPSLSPPPAVTRFRLLSFSPFSSPDFFLLVRFPPDTRLRTPLILLCRIALLCIISIAAGRPEVHIPLPHACRFLIYILDVCVLTRGCINVERERKVSRGMVGRKERGEARQKCVDFYFVTSLRAIRTHTRDTYSCCRHCAFHREIYRSIKVEHLDDKSAAIRAGT